MIATLVYLLFVALVGLMAWDLATKDTPTVSREANDVPPESP